MGDGSTRTGQVVNYAYQSPGSYSVSLTVRASGGGMHSASTSVTVVPESDFLADVERNTRPPRRLEH